MSLRWESAVVFASLALTAVCSGMINNDYYNQDFDPKYQIKPASCHISTAELLVTARNTANDILKGVCDPKDLESRLAVMENLLTDQLNVLKTMILNVEDKLGSQEDHYKKQFRRIQAMLARSSSSSSASTQTTSSTGMRRGAGHASSSSSISGNNNNDAGSTKSTNSVGSQATFDDSYYGRHAAARMLTHPQSPSSSSVPGGAAAAPSSPTSSSSSSTTSTSMGSGVSSVKITAMSGTSSSGRRIIAETSVVPVDDEEPAQRGGEEDEDDEDDEEEEEIVDSEEERNKMRTSKSGGAGSGKSSEVSSHQDLHHHQQITSTSMSHNHKIPSTVLTHPSSASSSSSSSSSSSHHSTMTSTSTPTGRHLASGGGQQQQQGLGHVYGTDTLQEVSEHFRLSYLDQGQDVGKFSTGSRQYEIDTYNATIADFNGQRVFRYYWKVKDVDYKITSWGQRRSLRSDSFYIFTYGYRMYVRIYPRQNGENFFIHVGLTQGDFDQMLEWPFKLKHFISVLDFSEKPEDVNSRMWDPKELCSGWNWRRPTGGDNYECVGLGFPIDLLRTKKYIVDDSIVLRLTVFLGDSAA